MYGNYSPQAHKLFNGVWTLHWDVFRDLWTDIDQFTDTISEYIGFCDGVCLPRKINTIYPNNKSWCTADVREKIKSKDIAYKNKQKDPSAYKTAKSKLRKSIKKAKLKYKDKLESLFDSRESRKLWGNINLITNYKGPKHSVSTDEEELPDKLNDFYARFDKKNKSTPSPLSICEYDPPPFEISVCEIRRELNCLKEHKAAGPDNISPRLLKKCSAEVAPVFCVIFNWSVQICKVPSIYKISKIIPVPKKMNAL